MSDKFEKDLACAISKGLQSYDTAVEQAENAKYLAASAIADLLEPKLAKLKAPKARVKKADGTMSKTEREKDLVRVVGLFGEAAKTLPKAEQSSQYMTQLKRNVRDVLWQRLLPASAKVDGVKIRDITATSKLQVLIPKAKAAHGYGTAGKGNDNGSKGADKRKEEASAPEGEAANVTPPAATNFAELPQYIGTVLACEEGRERLGEYLVAKHPEFLRALMAQLAKHVPQDKRNTRATK